MTIPDKYLPWVILLAVLLLGIIANLAFPYIYSTVMNLITDLNTLR